MSMFRRRLLVQNALRGEEKPPLGKYIKFEDKEVERLCMENFSSDGIGVSYEDAEKVDKFSTLFRENPKIKKLNDLRHFKNAVFADGSLFKIPNLEEVSFPVNPKYNYSGLSSRYILARCNKLKKISGLSSYRELGDLFVAYNTLLNIAIDLPLLGNLRGESTFRQTGIIEIKNLGSIERIPRWCFEKCTNLSKAILPSTLKNIDEYAFLDDANLDTIIIYATSVPILNATALVRCGLKNGIYVPNDSVDVYKTAPNWSTYADKIKPLSEYVPE